MSDLRDLRVLAIDDDPDIRELTRGLLGELQVTNVDTASDGIEALLFLESSARPPNVILCDLNMPGMDGIEFMRHLGEKRVQSGVILISGEDTRILHAVGALTRAHNLYVLGIVPKPIDLQLLETLLHTYTSDREFNPRPVIHSITEGELVEGLLSDALFLVYQPKVETASRKLVGVEALARWRHPKRGVVGPDGFIPLAESARLMDKLTDIVLKKAIAQSVQWRKAGLDLSVSINFSTSTLTRLDLPEYVVSCAAAAGLESSSLVIELTESKVMTDLKSSLEILARMRMKGLGLSIDDFGTGHANLTELKLAPFNEMKIDQSFVFGAAGDPATHAILRSSVELGKRMNMTVVAEGAETQEDWDTAAALGCDLVQGYFVARPMPGDELLKWARDWKAP